MISRDCYYTLKLFLYVRFKWTYKLIPVNSGLEDFSTTNKIFRSFILEFPLESIRMQDCVAVHCIILVPPCTHSLEMARIRQFLPSPQGRGEEADLFVNHSLFKHPTSHLCVMYLPSSKPTWKKCFTSKDY